MRFHPCLLDVRVVDRTLDEAAQSRNAREGLWGIYETCDDNAGTGVWRHYHPSAQQRDLGRVHFQGGSIGKTAHTWGLTADRVAIMAPVVADG